MLTFSSPENSSAELHDIGTEAGEFSLQFTILRAEMIEHSGAVFAGGRIGAKAYVAGWLPTSAELEGKASVGVGARYRTPLPAADRLISAASVRRSPPSMTTVPFRNTRHRRRVDALRGTNRNNDQNQAGRSEKALHDASTQQELTECTPVECLCSVQI